MAPNSSTLKKSIVRERLKAFAVDYLIILVYAGLLFAATLLVCNAFSMDLQNLGPAVGQALGFASLTLPVILYFTITENGKYAGTLGKRKFNLRVVSNGLTKAGLGQLLIRNCLKFLPWEMAHFFIFRLVQFTRLGVQPPDWVAAGLICSQGLALLYLLCLLLTKNNRGPYELISSTRVVSTSSVGR